MTSTPRTSARTALTAALVGAFALAAATLGFAPGTDRSSDARLPFAASFAGVSGPSSVWRGQVHGQPGGRVQFTLRQVEGPLEAANPVWHVEARSTVEAEPTGRSFTAALEGMVDWKSGAAHLSGSVTSGWMKGAWVQVNGQFVNGDLSGSLELAQTTGQ